MSVKTGTVLKSYFETGDAPTQAQFTDLIDTIGGTFGTTAVELGLLPTNTGAQNSAAWDAMYSLFPIGSFPRIQFGTGVYNFAGALDVKRSMVIEGVHGSFQNSATVFQFPVGSSGLVMRGYYEYSGAELETRADWSQVRDLCVQGGGASGTVGHGIYMRARATLHNVTAYNFSGDGIHIVAGTGAGPLGENTNANNWQIIGGRVVNNKRHGLFVDGGDSNAGWCIGLDAEGNSEWGVYDSSFLGNTYLACHTSINGNFEGEIGGAYKSDSPAGNTLFLGCYSEGGQYGSDIAHPAMVVGGAHGAQIRGTGTWVNSNISNHWKIAFSGLDPGGGAVAGTLDFGGDAAAANLLRIDTDLDALLTYLKFDGAYQSRGFYSWDQGETGAEHAFLISGDNAQSALLRARPIPPARLVFPDAFYLGDRKFAASDAVPTTGEWEVGDRIFKSNASAGSIDGWVCTTSGYFGTYTDGRTGTSGGVEPMILLSGANTQLLATRWITINGANVRMQRIYPWRPNAFYQATASDPYIYVSNVGNVYYRITTGTSAASGGPTGTGADITDGTVHWKYIGPANTTIAVDAVLTASASAISFTTPLFAEFGRVAGGAGDSTGTPGAATLNTQKGRSAIAIGAAAVTITNNLVTAANIVHATLQTSDATLTQILRVVPAVDSFTITGNAVATAAVNIGWSIE